MVTLSLAKAPFLTLKETADDGSEATPNPDADYRRVFLGEDGQLHAKDSSGTVTALGGASDAADVTFDPTGLDNTAATDVQAALEDFDAAITAGGGGGGAPTTAKYVVTAADGGLSAEIVLPGLAASIDIPAGGGSDHEFDAALSGWTDLGTPDVRNANSDALSHLHLKGNATATAADLKGIYRASPSLPFTMTAKLSDAYIRADYNVAGIAVAEATPGKLASVAAWHATDPKVSVDTWANRTSNSTIVTALSTNLWPGLPMYLRIVATSSTNVAYYWSETGGLFRLITSGHNPGFTIGSIVLFVNSGNSTHPGEALFDWVRFT